MRLFAVSQKSIEFRESDLILEADNAAALACLPSSILASHLYITKRRSTFRDRRFELDNWPNFKKRLR
jgi:hypothetical protein